MAKVKRDSEHGFWKVVLTCEHAGYQIPQPFRQQLSKTDQKALTTHRGWDPGAKHLAEYLAKNLDLPLYSNHISRLLVDANRSTHHPQVFGPSFRRLSQAEKTFLLAAYYWPHRNRIEQEIMRSLLQGRPVLHLAIHSFTPKLKGVTRQAELGILYDPKRRGERVWSQQLIDGLKDSWPGHRIRKNYPYLGSADGLTTWFRKHYSPHEYLGLEVEINQALLTEKASWLGLKKAFLEVLDAEVLAQFSFGSK